MKKYKYTWEQSDTYVCEFEAKNEEEAKNVDYISKFLDKLKEKDLLIANLGSGNTKFNGITKLTLAREFKTSILSSRVLIGRPFPFRRFTDSSSLTAITK